MDAGGHRHGQTNAGGLGQDGDGLQGVTHDKGGLGIAPGLLMQAFDPRHLFPLLGPFQAVHQHHGPSVDPHPPPPEEALEGLVPEPGQLGQVQRGRMKEVQEAMIAGIGQAQPAHEAGDAGQIRAQTQARQDHHQPEKGGGAGAGRAQRLEGAPAGQPEEEGAGGFGNAGETRR